MIMMMVTVALEMEEVVTKVVIVMFVVFVGMAVVVAMVEVVRW